MPVQPGLGTREYVVEVDRESMARSRATVLRLRRVSARIGVIAGCLIIAVALADTILIAQTTRQPVSQLWPLSFMVIPGLMLIFSARKEFAALRRRQAAWEEAGMPPVAMRLSAEGLGCSAQTATGYFFVPWSAVAGLRVKRMLGMSVLAVDLVPGVTAATPGVIGLDRPGRRPWIAVRSMRRPLGEIDAALAHYTDGRVRIH